MQIIKSKHLNLANLIMNNSRNYQQQYYQTSSNKIGKSDFLNEIIFTQFSGQFNNAPQISIDNKTIHFVEKNSGKSKNIREDDKVNIGIAA